MNANRRHAEHAIRGADITLNARNEPIRPGRNLTRFQRACKSAEQSPTDGRNDVVERREHLLIRLDTIEVLDRAVDAESNRLLEGLDDRVPDRTSDPLDADSARIDMVSHLQHPRSPLLLWCAVAWNRGPTPSISPLLRADDLTDEGVRLATDP